MDIISEILNAEKQAEQKLNEAEEKSRSLLKECDEEIGKLQQESAEKIKKYESDKNAEADKEIMTAEKAIEDKEKEKIKDLDLIFEKNHTDWENQITERIIAM